MSEQPTPAFETPAGDAASASQHEPSSDTAAPLEQPFPGYHVTAKIAQGGMGAVFLARDTRLDRDVAIKALIPDLENNEDAVAQFFGEARNVARLRHPNIIRGLDVGRAGKYFYFVMEYVRGETVLQKLARLGRGHLPEREALGVVQQIGAALQHVFENGLVHRDVKPGNILLTEEGEAKLCDLGVAREVAFATSEALVKGSPAYASPEQVRGDPGVDIRADLYGLGCTWFHMLLGQPPFVGQTAAEVIQKQLHEPPPDPCSLASRISRASGDLILWLLAKDPQERPRTPAEFLERLAEHPLAEGEAAE